MVSTFIYHVCLELLNQDGRRAAPLLITFVVALVPVVQIHRSKFCVAIAYESGERFRRPVFGPIDIDTHFLTANAIQ